MKRRKTAAFVGLFGLKEVCRSFAGKFNPCDADAAKETTHKRPSRLLPAVRTGKDPSMRNENALIEVCRIIINIAICVAKASNCTLNNS